MDDLQTVHDKIEIKELLYRYARGCDSKDWKLLTSVFTPDAHLDYSSAGFGAGSAAVTSMTAAGADTTGVAAPITAAGWCCIFCLTRTPHSTLSMWLLMNEKGTFLPHMGHVT